MALYRLSQRFRRRFKPKETDSRQDKDTLEFKILLLDESDLTFYIHKKSKGQVLLDLIFKNLDLVEKDYFGLQFMDTHQVSHWLDPTKKIKKQVKIGPPFTLHFRVKFYAADPQDLGEELTRYHFFLQLKQDIAKNKLQVPQKMAIELVAYSLQSQLGDYESDLHGEDYMEELKFYPNQNKELEKEILKKHKSLIGLSPAECEVNFLRLIKKLDFYGINLHKVQDIKKMEFQLGLSPRGIAVIRENEQVAFYFWPKISKVTFKKKHFILEVHEDQKMHETYHYLLPNAQAAKHLWKCAIEHHTFFRLVKTSARPKRTSSFLRFGSRFRYSGRTEYQTQRDARMSSRKSMKFKRASSERFSKRTTIGFIRVGSRVWGKALNGDFYKGIVTGLGQMIHIKFDNGDTIAHDRNDTECVVFDVDPDPSEIQIGTRVIAHWPTLPAYLAGNVIGMEHHKYYVQYDDGDKHHNEINQMRLLKPPIYFGPGSDIRKVKLKKKSESMKVTSLTGKAVITTELPRKVSNQQTEGEGVLRSSSLPTTIRAQTSEDRKESKTLPVETTALRETNVDSGYTINPIKHKRNVDDIAVTSATCVPDLNEDNDKITYRHFELDAQRPFPVFPPTVSECEVTKRHNCPMSEDSIANQEKRRSSLPDVRVLEYELTGKKGSNNNPQPAGSNILVTDL